MVDLVKTNNATGPILSPAVPVVFKSDKPAARRKIHMKGKVWIMFSVRKSFLLTHKSLTIRVRVLLPLVSIRNNVGMVATT